MKEEYDHAVAFLMASAYASADVRDRIADLDPVLLGDKYGGFLSALRGQGKRVEDACEAAFGFRPKEGEKFVDAAERIVRARLLHKRMLSGMQHIQGAARGDSPEEFIRQCRRLADEVEQMKIVDGAGPSGKLA